MAHPDRTTTMPFAVSRPSVVRSIWPLLALAVAMLPLPVASASPRDIVAAVVSVRAEVPPEARTADTLGRERTGSGVVIDSSGLVVTIGYLILEASAVDIYDAA